MKKVCTTIFILTILISACSSSISATPPDASESAPTVTQVPATVTATEIPPTPRFTPTPTLLLPVSQFTPVPASNTKLTAENLKDLQEIARYYGEVNYAAKLTKDNKYLFILDPDGLTKYNYATMESITHIGLANSVSDLQISDDGGLLILDNNWLLNLKNDKEPKLHILSERIHLLNFYTRTFSLSSDGTVIAVEQNQLKCDTCEHIFRIVSTEDFTDLYTSSGLTHQSLPTFSSDGQYFALADLFIEAHSDGSSNPAGASVSVWTTNDFTRVVSFSVQFPFYVTDIAFSEDKNLLAIAQSNSIDIYDLSSGESRATIADLCQSDLRKILFAATAPIRVLESSDCGSGEWAIAGSTAILVSDTVPDLSRIVFDEKGSFKAVPYPQPSSPDVSAYYQEDYFVFLNDDILSFKYPDTETWDSHSCDFSLADGSFDCQSHAQEYNNKRYLGKDVLLATDGKYYSYVVGKSTVDIFSFDNPSEVYYSIPFRYFSFTLYALDPINDIIIYELAIGGDSNRVVIQDMKNDRILEKWEGETFISSIGVSENSRVAALCRTIGYYSNPLEPYKDRLTIFDLLEKRTVYNTEFNCSAALDMSNDGSKLAIEHHYVPSPNDGLFSSRAMVLNTTPPYEKKLIEFDSFLFPYAVAFSPDGSVLAIGCGGIEICFFDSSGDNEIYRLKAHSGITNLAFSPDGSLLATSSHWGLISLWAVPPFTSNIRQSQPSPISAYTPGFSWDFDEEDSFEGWGEQDWQSVDLKDLKVENGYLSASATGNDPQISSNEGLGIDATKFTHIEVRMRVTSGDSAELFFRHEKDDMSGERLKIFSIQAGDEFKTYRIDMRNVSGWTGIIHQLRFDPTVDAVGATIKIDYIRLLP